ncbi:MAG: glycoside hydrolase family 127 protein [Bacillota bacterium]|nr:glycoside hydrolase family 127 protein [Bacillota bacterium]
MKKIKVPNASAFKLGEGFWQRFVKLVQEDVIPYQWEILNDLVPGAEPSHAIKNFKMAAGEMDGEFYGMVFQDSDVAKWLEAVAYSLEAKKDEKLETLADEVIDLIARAQQDDGYLNTYFTVKEPDKRWTNLRDCHELYCAGHMMEAAVAYYEATGKKKLLDVMNRMAKHIDSVIGPEKGKLHGIPGHQEIELALVKMYEATGDSLMLKMAEYFINERGKKPNFFHIEQEKRGGSYHFPLHAFGEAYAQNHLPVREQLALEGHSVRALYMATGMADLARVSGDKTLLDACKVMFDNLIAHRMYITGGVGSTHIGEAFTFDDDLPNDTMYNETCASIALCFFTRAMLQIDLDSRYADAMERALFNTCIAGMSLDGHNFFYVNPLEVWPESSHKDPGKKHVLPVRPAWFGCACCPPNLARLLMSLSKYAYGYDRQAVYVHQYIAGEVTLGERVVHLKTAYPYEGNMLFTLSPGKYAIYLRIPDYVKNSFVLSLNNAPVSYHMEKGYAIIEREWQPSDKLNLTFDIKARRVYPNPRLRENVGRVALMRGPIVYCLEEKDNGHQLNTIALDYRAEINEIWKKDKLSGIYELHAQGSQLIPQESDSQYLDSPPKRVEKSLIFIPYYTWANRGENEMVVWVMDK